jgi:hypothetical protein
MRSRRTGHASGRPLKRGVRRLLRFFADLNVALRSWLLWGMVVLTLLPQAGCCVSYSRVAAVDRNSARDRPDVAGLVAVSERAAKQLGFKGREDHYFDSGRTIYSLQDDRNRLTVLIDEETLAIGLSWDWRSARFASQVQSAIEREFTATYNSHLQFKDRPCGWFGP